MSSMGDVIVSHQEKENNLGLGLGVVLEVWVVLGINSPESLIGIMEFEQPVSDLRHREWGGIPHS